MEAWKSAGRRVKKWIGLELKRKKKWGMRDEYP